MWSAQAAAHHAGCSGGLARAPSKAVAAAAEGGIRCRRARSGAAEAALRSKAAAQANVPRPSRRRSRAVVLEPSIADHEHVRPADKFTAKQRPHTALQQLVLSGCRESQPPSVRWGSTWGGACGMRGTLPPACPARVTTRPAPPAARVATSAPSGRKCPILDPMNYRICYESLRKTLS